MNCSPGSEKLLEEVFVLSAMQSKREQSAKHPPGNTSGVFLGTVQQKTNVGGQSACEKRGSRMQNGTPPSSVSISVLCLGLASTGSASHPAES